MTYTITITTTDGQTETITTESQAQARAICREEIQWEATVRVICPELGFDETGFFN